ncbi:hypothetical protein [Acidipila sp. EB88]|uniref:hypothetical protein n=1 Tax=Acidipila sp. EB88 TaxID=2305226 RepID=UPI000F5DEF4E|nr:hypothetical protein [Acidipila sp. EB88]RRA48018.1 hypothetical protein D1Y84_06680 [Acidipila sp. EB88]
MNHLSSAMETLTNTEPFAWLLVLISLYVARVRRNSVQRTPATAKLRYAPIDDRPLAVFVALRLLMSLNYLIWNEASDRVGSAFQHFHHIYTAVYWSLYFMATITAFFVISAILANSLAALPALASAAKHVFRWAAGLALVIALSAHLPIFGIHSMQHWLDEVDVSFMLCVCTFEFSLISLLLTRVNRLGMCLRSRSVGLAAGLTMIGAIDFVGAVTFNVSGSASIMLATLNEVGTFVGLSIWVFYLVFPEPARTPHTLSPASKLMRWNEIAQQFGTVGRQPESLPFISRVEATVADILERHGVGRAG